MTNPTLAAFAQLICGNVDHGFFNADFAKKVAEGAYRPPASYPVPSPCRSSWEMRDLFINLKIAPAADVTALFDARKDSQRPRFEPVLACLQEFCNSDTGIRPEMDRLLCELGAARTYEGFPDIAASALDFLNGHLRFEGFELVLGVGGRPHVKPFAESPTKLTGAFKVDIDFGPSTRSDKEAMAFLSSIWAELKRCYDAEAYLAALVLTGTVLELLLRTRLAQEPAATKAAKESLNINLHDSYLSLGDLSKIAIQAGWLKREREKPFEAAREARNRFVHPMKGKMDIQSDKGTTDICLSVIGAALDDLAAGGNSAGRQ